MIKAVFLDFYGTVVFEDGEYISRITQQIYHSGQAENVAEIGTFWWQEFQTMYMKAYRDDFQTQRALEYQSLKNTIEKYHSDEDARVLSQEMFRYWVQPPVFDESKEFFDKCPLPIYIVSNIDRADILQAIQYHDLKPDDVFTSEDARSYKPRKELFELALYKTGRKADEIAHIGDSLSSDVKGARALGIHAIWLNRGNREVPEGVLSIANLLEVFDTEYFYK